MVDEVLDSSHLKAIKAKLICQDCERSPRPNIPLYICQRSYKVFVICRGCLGGGLVAQLLFT